jgi:hypothetical protein
MKIAMYPSLSAYKWKGKECWSNYSKHQLVKEETEKLGKCVGKTFLYIIVRE